jgi:hypothetical protein
MEQTLADKIIAVNAYADFLTALGDNPFNHRDPQVKALRNAAGDVIAETDTWNVVDDQDARNVLLQAPDGTLVRLTATYITGAVSVERLILEETQPTGETTMCVECTNNALAEEMDNATLYCEVCDYDASDAVALVRWNDQWVCEACLEHRNELIEDGWMD